MLIIVPHQKVALMHAVIKHNCQLHSLVNVDQLQASVVKEVILQNQTQFH